MLTKVFFMIKNVILFIYGWLCNNQNVKTTRQVVNILYLLSQKTNTKFDDKLIKLLTQSLNLINSDFSLVDEVKNISLAKKITNDDIDMKGLVVGYEEGKFSLGLDGWPKFKYDPKNGGFEIEKTIRL